MSGAPAAQRRRGWLPLLAFGVLYTAALTIIVAVRAEENPQKGTTDFRDYWRTALHFRTTGQISSELGIHNYLPFFPIFMLPWSWLPLRVAAGAFTVFSMALFALTVLLTEILLNGRLGPRPRWALPAALGLMLAYVHSSGVLGAVELLVLFLIVAAWFLFERGHEWKAGLPLGLAVLIKILPALLIVFFLMKRRWRVAASAAGACLVFGLGLPLALLGPAETWRQGVGFYERAVVLHSARATLTVEKPEKAKYSNVALPITLRRLLSHTNANPVDEPGRELYVNIVDWPGMVLWNIYLATLFFLVVVTGFATWRDAAAGPPQNADQLAALRAQFGLWCCLLLLASPLAWTRYLLLAYWPLALLADRLERVRRAEHRWCRAAATALLVWLAAVLLLAWPAARAAGAPLIAVFCVWGALVRLSIPKAGDPNA